jgi:drug/metabolite transporter (DMT)-like permease
MTERSERLAAFAAAITGFQVGAAIVATRFVIDQTGPASLAMIRYFIGFLCLLPVLAMSRRIKFERRDILPIALLGIAQFGILIALLNFGVQYVSAGRSALLFATFPLLTMVLAAALGREALTRDKSLGVLLTILGVGLALGRKVFEGGGGTGGEEWIGVVAVLASALTGAVCSVFYRPYLQKYPTLQVSTFAMLASVVALAFLALAEGSLATLGAIDLQGWLAILFIGFSSGVGYFLWLWALRHTTPTKVSVFIALSPLTAALLGAALLGEALDLGLLSGLLCVAAGLWLAHRPVSSMPVG